MRPSSAARPHTALVTALVVVVAMWVQGVVAAPAHAASGDPRGNLEEVRGGEDVVPVKGWAFDGDASGSTYVWVTVDGVGSHLYANDPRPDVAAVVDDAGPAHGFRGEVAASPGRHTVCVTAANVGPGQHLELGCRVVEVVASGTPVGNLEHVRAGQETIDVAGWALDRDAPGETYVWASVDGVGRHLATDRPRPDVATTYPGHGDKHGFAATLPAGAGRHTVCVTASNSGPGKHRELGCRVVHVLPVATPFGELTSVREVSGGIALSGWAMDPDTTDPVYVWVTVNGVGRHLLADRTRSDLGAAYPDHGPRHAFAATLPASSSGTSRVCVTISNVGPGAHEPLGCRTVGQVAVAEAQRILAKLNIPAGPVDGRWGPSTAQGMCTFRQLAGLPTSRGPITAADSEKLRAYDAAYGSLRSVPAPTRGGRSTYLVANLTCQTMLLASGGTYSRVFRISSGRDDFETPAGRYYLSATQPGWSCSTLFPEACYDRPQGINAKNDVEGALFSTYGNMYNKRSFLGAYMLHGSGFVPSYPASHGCIRVTISDSDWMYRNLTNAGGRILFDVVGRY